MGIGKLDPEIAGSGGIAGSGDMPVREVLEILPARLRTVLGGDSFSGSLTY